MPVHYVGQFKFSYIKWDMTQPQIPDSMDAQYDFKCRCYRIHTVYFSPKPRWFCPEALRPGAATVNTHLLAHFHRQAKKCVLTGFPKVSCNWGPTFFSNQMNVRIGSSHKPQLRTDHLDLLNPLLNKTQLNKMLIHLLK